MEKSPEIRKDFVPMKQEQDEVTKETFKEQESTLELENMTVQI